MDRKFTLSRPLFELLCVMGFFLSALQAECGVKLLPPEQPMPLKPGESYPESVFGEEPPRPETGLDSGFARRKEDPLGKSQMRHSSRGPASVVDTPAGSKEKDSNQNSELEHSFGTSPSVMQRKGVQEAAIIAGDLGFFPKTVFLTRDLPVRLFVTGSSQRVLCMIMDSFQVRRQIRSDQIEEITFTPQMPGTFRFYCPVNGAEGTLVVKESGSSLSSEPSK